MQQCSRQQHTWKQPPQLQGEPQQPQQATLPQQAITVLVAAAVVDDAAAAVAVAVDAARGCCRCAGGRKLCVL